jgi:acyl dehydratase
MTINTDTSGTDPGKNPARMAEAELDDEMLERMRSLIGVDLRIDHSVNNEEATRLAVERFADAIGDPNPLWRDREQAEASVYGRRVAPPSFVLGCFSGLQFGWPGLGAFHNASDLRFHRPVFIGDTVTATCRYEGFDGPKPSSFASVMVTDQFLNTYRNQDGEVLAEVRWWVMNFMRQKAKAAAGDRKLELPHPWTTDEVEEIEADVLAEQPRGAEPRWWDDVEIGDQLDTVTKGPIGMTDEVAYVAAGGPPIPRVAANAVALHQYEKHPAWAFRDPHTMALEPIYAVHYNEAAAKAMGVALQYDVGFQRQCWHIHLLTHWMGDDAWIARADAQYRSFVYHGSPRPTTTSTVTPSARTGGPPRHRGSRSTTRSDAWAAGSTRWSVRTSARCRAGSGCGTTRRGCPGTCPTRPTTAPSSCGPGRNSRVSRCRQVSASRSWNRPCRTG